jgi:hypothetical protein
LAEIFVKISTRSESIDNRISRMSVGAPLMIAQSILVVVQELEEVLEDVDAVDYFLNYK